MKELTPRIINKNNCSVFDYFTIADATWNNLMLKVAQYINQNGGKATVASPQITRIDFKAFYEKFKSEKPVNFILNIKQSEIKP